MAKKSFEDIAFELFKKLCPDKNLKYEQIPYQRVRNIVEMHLNSMDPEKKQHLLAHLSGESEQGPSETQPKVVSRGASPVKPKSVSEYRNALLAERHHLLPKLEDYNEAQKIHLRYPKNVRKFVRARTDRRLAAETNDFVNIVCDERKLPEIFLSIYDQILRKRKSSLQCYHAIINTLHHYYMRTTWSDLVPDAVNEFIQNHIILTCNGLTTKYDRQNRDADIFERLREYELMVLLELHLIKKCPDRIKQTGVVSKLGFLVFVADSVYMKNFLDETICDQFAHIMPKAIVVIYDELCLKLPLDLEDQSYKSSSSKTLEFREAGRRSSRKSGPGSAKLLELERKVAEKKTRRQKRYAKYKSMELSPEAERSKRKARHRTRVRQAERVSRRIAAREKAKIAGSYLRI
ncbi:unnamed protein product [Thelazia callipaeda]|uniref:Treslin_N domain-containing protein n=1 Tax=Thelazia callipaeda TaxID=103827 RepID=A0A0N5D0J4_THECL|nr:unnamed protein product [Thelazia callipaeda]